MKDSGVWMGGSSWKDGDSTMKNVGPAKNVSGEQGFFGIGDANPF